MLWNSEALGDSIGRQVVFCRTEAAGEAAQALMPKMCVVALNGGEIEREIDSRFTGRRVVVLDAELGGPSSPSSEFSASSLASLFHAAGVAELKAWPLDPAEANGWSPGDLLAHAKAHAWIIAAPQQDAVESAPDTPDAAPQQPNAAGGDSSPVDSEPSLSHDPVPRPAAPEYDEYEYEAPPGLDLSVVYGADHAEVVPEPQSAPEARLEALLADMIAELDQLDDGRFYTAWMGVSEKTKADMPADVRARMIARFRKASGREVRSEPLGKLRLAQNRYGTPEVAEQEEWPPLVDPFGDAVLPPFRYEWVPPALEDRCRDIAELTASDGGITYLNLLGIANACLSQEIQVRMRQRQEWLESARLWLCVVARSGGAKTPSLNMCLSELKELSIEIAIENARAIGAWNTEAEIYKEQRKAWIAKRAKGEAAGEEPILRERPPEVQLYYSDFTRESLTKGMAGSARGAAVVRDELLALFAQMSGAYKAGGGDDRQMLLEAYNGGRMVVNRAGTGRTVVDQWGLSVLGASQPRALRMAMGKMQMESDGLIQRVCVYLADVPTSLTPDRAMDQAACERWKRIVRTLYRMRPALEQCHFSPDAQAALGRFEAWCVDICNSEHYGAHLREHVAKYRGIFGRLALLDHAIACADAGHEAIAPEIGLDVAERTESALRECFFPHAHAFYSDMMGEDDVRHAARKLCEYMLLRRGPDDPTVSVTQFSQGAAYTWHPLSPAARKSVIERLCEWGWMLPGTVARTLDGVPRSYRINPAIWSVYADEIPLLSDLRDQRREQIYAARAAKAGRLAQREAGAD